MKGGKHIERLYEDESVLAVNKPAWYMVHPSTEERRAFDVLSTLEQRHLSPIHRLDRQTSGVLLLSKSPHFTREIQKIWSTQKVKKTYLAYVYGAPPCEFESERELSDKKTGQKKSAHTCFKTIEYFDKGALIQAEIITGRRHQIRRHLSHLGFHILGDSMYGKGRINHWARENGLNRLFLHAKNLNFWHPTKNVQIEIECPMPEELSSFLSKRQFDNKMN